MPNDEQLFAQEDNESEVDPAALVLGDQEVYTTPSDPDVKTLLGRIEDGSLILRPRFQRASVWDEKRKSRLVESLLLNLPIPPCFLGEDEDGSRVVIDGQQRLIAIDDFYHGRYALKGLEILSDLNGKRWRELPSKYDRKILQSVIRTLVVSRHTDSKLRFLIFERLNTGAVPLTDQEIRNATLNGTLNSLLDEAAKSPAFLAAMRVEQPDVRLRHHELILRFLAVEDVLADYRPPLKFILTTYMKTNRNIDADQIIQLRTHILQALRACELVFGVNAFRRYRIYEDNTRGYERVISRALFDLQMISLSGIPVAQLERRGADIEESFKQLVREDPDFSESFSRATDHRSRFYLRFRKWVAALESLGLPSAAANRLPVEH